MTGTGRVGVTPNLLELRNSSYKDRETRLEGVPSLAWRVRTLEVSVVVVP